MTPPAVYKRELMRNYIFDSIDNSMIQHYTVIYVNITYRTVKDDKV